MTIAIGFILLIIMAMVLRKNKLNARRSHREFILDNDDFSSNRNSHKPDTFSSEDYAKSYEDGLNHQLNSGNTPHSMHEATDLHQHNYAHSHSETLSHDYSPDNSSVSDTTDNGG